MMWELIRKNRMKSVLLLFGMGAILIALGYFIGIAELENAWAGIILAAIIWLIVALSSFWGGKSIMLANTGAYQLTEANMRFHQLFNLVEEMRIAANMDFAPQVYLITDRSLNAFAVGNRRENYAIVLTMGLLEKLNRNELQAVIAHELSHIISRDSQFMTFAGTILGAIQILRKGILENRRYSGGSRYRSSKSKSNSNSDSGSGKLVAYLILIAIAVFGTLLATMFYFAISRKREYLADASAVRLTRYPQGLASALAKISRDAKLSSANSINAPMFIVNPLSDVDSWGFSTHPSIYERIEILRKMSEGADFASYQRAYSKSKGKDKRIIPSHTLRQESHIALLNPNPEPEIPAQAEKGFRVTSETSFCKNADMVRAGHHFSFIDCDCSLKIKIPFGYNAAELTCPRCGTVHANPTATVD